MPPDTTCLPHLGPPSISPPRRDVAIFVGIEVFRVEGLQRYSGSQLHRPFGALEDCGRGLTLNWMLKQPTFLPTSLWEDFTLTSYRQVSRFWIGGGWGISWQQGFVSGIAEESIRSTGVYRAHKRIKLAVLTLSEYWNYFNQIKLFLRDFQE